MKMLILAAFAALSLSVVAVTQEVQAAASSATPSVEHSSPAADDIGLSPSGSELEGGWG